ncbi:MAG: hypothetical protein KKB70_07400 [Proteobacteria bacterium]|nr:hypothetical protein [Pseudomonadota bacterium]
MSFTETFVIKEFEKDGFDFRIIAENPHEGAYSHFHEQWEGCNKHVQGLIRNPVPCRNSYPYFKPLQYTLDQLSSDFAAQGRPNPSKEAYDSLLAQLRWDNHAEDCHFKVEVSRNGVGLVNEYAGFSFVWSWEDPLELAEFVRVNGIVDDWFDEAEWVAKAKDALEEMRCALCE